MGMCDNQKEWHMPIFANKSSEFDDDRRSGSHQDSEGLDDFDSEGLDDFEAYGEKIEEAERKKAAFQKALEADCTPMQTAALQYAQLNLSVLAVRPDGEKIPAGEDPEAIRALFADESVMLGIATGKAGHGVLVVACEKGKGAKEFYELCRTHGSTTSTSAVKTPGGGRHYYYRMGLDQCFPSRTDWLPGVSLICDDDAVLVPPTHTADGDYAYLDTRASILDFPDLPDWLYARITGAERPKAGRKDAPQTALPQPERGGERKKKDKFIDDSESLRMYAKMRRNDIRAMLEAHGCTAPRPVVQTTECSSVRTVKLPDCFTVTGSAKLPPMLPGVEQILRQEIPLFLYDWLKLKADGGKWEPDEHERIDILLSQSDLIWEATYSRFNCFNSFNKNRREEHRDFLQVVEKFILYLRLKGDVYSKHGLLLMEIMEYMPLCLRRIGFHFIYYHAATKRAAYETICQLFYEPSSFWGWLADTRYTGESGPLAPSIFSAVTQTKQKPHYNRMVARHTFLCMPLIKTEIFRRDIQSYDEVVKRYGSFLLVNAPFFKKRIDRWLKLAAALPAELTAAPPVDPTKDFPGIVYDAQEAELFYEGRELSEVTDEAWKTNERRKDEWKRTYNRFYINVLEAKEAKKCEQ